MKNLKNKIIVDDENSTIVPYWEEAERQEKAREEWEEYILDLDLEELARLVY